MRWLKAWAPDPGALGLALSLIGSVVTSKFTHFLFMTLGESTLDGLGCCEDQKTPRYLGA